MMIKRDTSHSIISMMKADTKSLLKSEVDVNDDFKKQIETKTNIQTTGNEINARKIQKPSNQLKSIKKSKQSIPYRLYINRVFDIPSIAKKGNTSTLFMHFSINMYLKKDRGGADMQAEPIGQTYHYQCEQSLFRKDQTRHQVPASFFYHSKVDKNSHSVFFAVSLKILEMKSGVTQFSHNLGFFIIEDPFIETSELQTINLCRQQLFQIEYVQFDDYKQMSKGSQSARVQFQIRSLFQLKKLVKLIPENEIFTSHDKIVGLNDVFLTNDHEIQQIVESASLNIKIKYLQIHIPDKFEQNLLSVVKKFPNQMFGPKDEIKNRKIVMSFFNLSNLLNPIEKRLQFVNKQSAGDWNVLIYQGLKDGENLNFPYFIEDRAFPMSVLLIYQIADKELQVAHYFFSPTINGDNHEISEEMITNNMIYPLKTSNIVKTNCNRKPTIITQYASEQILDNQSFVSGFAGNQIGFRSSQTFMKSSHKLIQDKTLQLKQKQRLHQQIQREKLALQKERNEIEKIKTQNYISYQEQFERRFQLEKESLMKRQQLLQTQYREQVQREIRQKNELEQQIKEMKEKVNKIEGLKNLKQIQENANYDSRLNQVDYSQMPGSFINTNHFKTGFHNTAKQSGRQQRGMANPNMQIRQRIDPGYLVQPERTMPVTKVRQIIKKTQVNKQLVQISKNQFNRGSKFTFTFSSIAWFDEVTRPNEVFFLIRFFNFAQYRTDKLSYMQNQNPQGYCQLLRTHQYNYNIEEVNPVYTFTVDPSQYRNPRILQQDLIDYLCDNNCIVDIFDGQTHIYLGQINIKLTELIRGNKNQALIAKQYNLIKIKTKLNLGSIQIVVKNQQIMCKQSLHLKINSTVKEEKKKVISYSPMVVPKLQNNLAKNSQKIVSSSKKDSHRIQERISKFKQRQKQRQLDQDSHNFIVLPQQDKTNALARINQHKQKNMNEYIKTVYSSLLHQKITINAEFGKAQTFPYTFVNQSTSASSYKIVIDSEGYSQQQADPTNKKSQSDLQVINNPSEWRYYVKKKGYMQPKFYQIINDNNVFYLHAGQSLSVVFRYLTFTHFSKSQEDINMNVSIIKIDSNWIAGGFNLSIELHEQIVHHSYILYEPGNQLIDLILPVIYSKIDQYGPGSIKKLYLTDEDDQTEAHWLNEYEIMLRLQTPQIMMKKTFNLLLYDDQYFDQLKQNWLIVLNSYEGVWTQCRPDANTKFKVSLPMNNVPLNMGLNFYSSSLNNSLILNSSDPSLQFENDRIVIQFSKMREGGAFQIWCQLLSSQNFKRQIEITCTSEQNSTLVYAWIIQIFPYSIKRN